MANVIGIDLGTTNTVVAVMRDGEAKVIPTSEGDEFIPSVICSDPATPDILHVGMPAKSVMKMVPDNAVYSTKRLMGMLYFDEEEGPPEKQAEDFERFMSVKSKLAYPLFPDPDGKDDYVHVKVAERYLKPEDVAELILAKAKQEAELFTGAPVTGAVITTPAYFEAKQKAATQRAAEQAGLKVLALLDEPNAAAMAAGYRPEEGPIRWVLVFDFGGGTFDASVLQISKEKDFHVFAKGGDNWLGGDDFDSCLIDLVEEHARNVAQASPEEIFELRRSDVKSAVENAKIELSTKDTVELNIPNCALVRPSHGGQPRLVSVTGLEIQRGTFEEKTRSILDQALAKVDDILQENRTVRTVIDDVLLIGGSTYIPAVRRAIEEQFPGKVRSDEDVNPMQEVALGAAIYADSLARQKEEGSQRPEHEIIDTLERSLGIECVDSQTHQVYRILIEKGTPLDQAESDYQTFHATHTDFLAIPVYAGEHEEATRNSLQGKIQVDIDPPVNVGHPVHIKLQVTQNRLIHVHTRIDGREELDHELVYGDRGGDDNWQEKLEEMLNLGQQFLIQYGSYIDDTLSENLKKHCEKGEKARDADARIEAISATRRIRRAILYSDQTGNQLFQAEQLSNATALSQERRNQLRDMANQAKLLYQACQDDPAPEHKKALREFGMVFETFLGLAYREAASGRHQGTRGLVAVTHEVGMAPEIRVKPGYSPEAG